MALKSTLSIFIMFFSLMVSVEAKVWRAGNSEGLLSVEDAVWKASHGDTIVIEAGEYDIQDLKIDQDIKLLGLGQVIFHPSQSVEKGILVPLWDRKVTIENIVFKNATSPDENGAGIRFEGMELKVIQCTFVNNENGILATGNNEGSVSVEKSTFLENGFGDGYSHGIYMSNGDYLTVSNTLFVGTKVGHHIKSVVSRKTTVSGNYFNDEDGHTSYVVDVTGGGDMSVLGNTIIRSQSADQSTLINYDKSRGEEIGSLVIQGNKILNRKNNVRLLRNPEKAPLVQQGNIVDTKKGKPVKMN